MTAGAIARSYSGPKEADAEPSAPSAEVKRNGRVPCTNAAHNHTARREAMNMIRSTANFTKMGVATAKGREKELHTSRRATPPLPPLPPPDKGEDTVPDRIAADGEPAPAVSGGTEVVEPMLTARRGEVC